MLTVVYEYHRLRQSEIRCYVDGQLILTAEVSLPSTDEVLYSFLDLINQIKLMETQCTP